MAGNIPVQGEFCPYCWRLLVSFAHATALREENQVCATENNAMNRNNTYEKKTKPKGKEDLRNIIAL